VHDIDGEVARALALIYGEDGMGDEPKEPPKKVVFLRGSDGLAEATQDYVVREALASGRVVLVEDCERALAALRPVAPLRWVVFPAGAIMTAVAIAVPSMPAAKVVGLLGLVFMAVDFVVLSRW
jgi:hypothetical protein